MSVIHFLNVLEGDCNIIQHDSGRISVIDVSNAYNDFDTKEELAIKNSAIREEMRKRTQVPNGKIDYKQKEVPDNPILYLKHMLKIKNIWRFIITHPDMDHIDGIRDLFEEFTVHNVWDTENIAEKEFSGNNYGGYNKEDWIFYKQIRDGKHVERRFALHAGDTRDFWNQDNISIICPTKELVKQANSEGGDIHDLSYVLLYTPPKSDGTHWKIVFAGDSHDNSWDYILKNHKDKVQNIDILFAPHHGRDSNRSYEFLNTLKPKVTLFGNASSEHLAYSKYPKTRITNNQAGHVLIDIDEDRLRVLVKNSEFAKNYTAERKWDPPIFDKLLNAYPIFKYNTK